MRIAVLRTAQVLVYVDKVNAKKNAPVPFYTSPCAHEASPTRINASLTVPTPEILCPVNAAVSLFAIQKTDVVEHATPPFDALSTNAAIYLAIYGVNLWGHAGKPVMRVTSSWRAYAMPRPAKKSLP
jgi:hypothetical protein